MKKTQDDLDRQSITKDIIIHYLKTGTTMFQEEFKDFNVIVKVEDFSKPSQKTSEEGKGK